MNKSKVINQPLGPIPGLKFEKTKQNNSNRIDSNSSTNSISKTLEIFPTFLRKQTSNKSSNLQEEVWRFWHLKDPNFRIESSRIEKELKIRGLRNSQDEREILGVSRFVFFRLCLSFLLNTNAK